MANKQKIFQLRKYYTPDNLVFDTLYSQFYNPIYSGILYSASTKTTISKKFRIDLAIADITVDFSLIKIVSILNEKPLGVFSYDENDVVYVPSPNAALSINTEINQLDDANIHIQTPLANSLKNTYSELQENLSKLDVTQINKYIKNVDKLYLFVETSEYIVNQKFKGLI